MLGEFAKYAFCGLKRKNPVFERSGLKSVSIKIPALTHSGCKSRACVNQPDRLSHTTNLIPAFCLISPSLSAFRAFNCLSPSPSSKAGREVAFLKLAGANAKAMAGVGRICKIRIFLA